MCGNQAQSPIYPYASSQQAITIADGTKIHAIGSDEVLIDMEGGGITLTSVLHIPDICEKIAISIAYSRYRIYCGIQSYRMYN